MDWETLIDETALAALLPASHSHYARPVAQGLVVFLSGLPEESQLRILSKQAALPPTAPLEERLGALALCSPVLQKLGQTLARDKRLAPELRVHLRALESTVPTVTITEIRQTLADELGPLEKRGITLLPPAIAEASVAVVIPFRQEIDGRTRNGVFKVLKPGIEERLHLELALLDRVGEHLDQRAAENGLPQIDYQTTFERIRQRLSAEVVLSHERRNLVKAAWFFRNDPEVLIPEVYELSTARVTAMQRVWGLQVTDDTLRDPSEGRRLAGLVARSLVSRPMLANTPSALFHSDPHAGNLFCTDDGRLAILDWSLVGGLEQGVRSRMVRIMLAAITFQPEKIVDALVSLSEKAPNNPAALQTVVESSLRQFRRGRLPGLRWAVDMLDAAVLQAGLTPPADLLLYRKSLLTLEGVIEDLAPTCFCLDRFVTCEFLRQFGYEWPKRWFAPPFSRRFATQLSNADLAEALMNAPLAAVRCCLDEGRCLLERDASQNSAIEQAPLASTMPASVM